jgi:threonine dehydrogenase-like Zn-dependent dehydrogenase
MHSHRSDIDLVALVEPLSVAYRAVKCSGATASSSVLCVGGGPIALGIILVLQALSVDKIVVSEPSAARRDLATTVGAARVIDPTTFAAEKIPEEVAKAFDACDSANNGNLADIAFDCAGVPASLNAVMSATKARGTIVNVAVWEKPPIFPMNMLTFREKTFRGTAAPDHDDFDAVLDLLRRGLIKDPLRMVTKRVRLVINKKTNSQLTITG